MITLLLVVVVGDPDLVGDSFPLSAPPPRPPVFLEPADADAVVVFVVVAPPLAVEEDEVEDSESLPRNRETRRCSSKFPARRTAAAKKGEYKKIH